MFRGSASSGKEAPVEQLELEPSPAIPVAPVIETMPAATSTPTIPTAPETPLEPVTPSASATCVTCGATVSDKVRAYCEQHSERFGGRIYCFKHQRGVRAVAAADSPG